MVRREDRRPSRAPIAVLAIALGLGNEPAPEFAPDDTPGTTAEVPAEAPAPGCACDDADPCTTDTCDRGSCTHAALVTNACRPQIDVTYPPRGATVLGTSGAQRVVVTGTVSSGLGTITSLMLNGAPVIIAPGGAFSHELDVEVGGNVLVFDATDDAGHTRHRVQSLLWSTDYRKPGAPPDATNSAGLGLWLAQSSIDDGDHALPVDDLATALELALGRFDTAGFTSTETPVASALGYQVYLTALAVGSVRVALQATDGGITVRASLQNIRGDLMFDCTKKRCALAGGDGNGEISIAALHVSATLQLAVDADHRLAATIVDVRATVDSSDVTIDSDNAWTDVLLSTIEPFVRDSLVADLETTAAHDLRANLGPALTRGLEGLALATTFEFPELGATRAVIPVDLAAHFVATDFGDAGGAALLYAAGATTRVQTPHDNRGAPVRAGCGTGLGDLVLPRVAPLELALTDDTVNQLLYAGWQGGLFEFAWPGLAIPGLVDALHVEVSGMLAPTISDCGPSKTLLATLGDVAIKARFNLVGAPVVLDAFATLIVRVEPRVSEHGIVLDLAGIERVELELTADDANLHGERAYAELLREQIVRGVLGRLGASGLGVISLPPIDLSTTLGLPLGTAVLAIRTDAVTRHEGTSVISGGF